MRSSNFFASCRLFFRRFDRRAGEMNVVWVVLAVGSLFSTRLMALHRDSALAHMGAE
jgi:hypothetical protein